MKLGNTLLTKSGFKQIFNKYYASMVLYANCFLTVRDECEDIVQDIFIHLWEKDNSFPDEQSLKIYLYKATRNKCYNVIKHNKVKEKFSKSVVKILEDDNIFLQHLLEEEITRKLYKAIETLPKRKKQIIKLSLKGLKNTEIAEALSIKLQTVKTLKSQSYKILRHQFKKYDTIIYSLLF